MIVVHGNNSSAEHEAAEFLARIASEHDKEIVSSQNVVLEIFPSVQCFGQRTQDIDLLVFYADYREEAHLFVSDSGQSVHSFCATIELKGHPPEAVQFEGATCSVLYQGKRHDVTAQSEKQKHSVANYIKRELRKPPWIINLIWLSRVNTKSLPDVSSNLIGMDVNWTTFLNKAAYLFGSNGGKLVQTFSSRRWMSQVIAVFSRRIQPSKIDRKRMEAITKSVLDRTKQQYAEKLGKQLLIYRGRGGTGKTVRLIRTAYQAYDELGWRVLLLTYNKALVADLRRLLALLGVKDAIGEGSIAIKTIHGFMYQWLSSLELVQPQQNNFLLEYEGHKSALLEMLRGGAISPQDLEKVRASNSRELAWDLILIDESQDWPTNERDLIYMLYGHEKVIIADGVDQFVRGVERIDWREGVSRAESQVVPLHKSLRLKASLCQAVSHFADEIEFKNWNLEPLPETQGGKVVVVVGECLSEKFHKSLAATAAADGNKPIDILLCVPPTWVARSEDGKGRRSRVAVSLQNWGLQVWDAVDSETRVDYPTSLEQFRIVQYDSCRGLEGWVVVCFGLDEFFEHKRANAEFGESLRQDLLFDEESAALEFAKRWLMIPLTRAIDTLVIHVTDESSYVGEVLKELHRKYPQDIQWRQT